jgi:hypothetical protein
MRRAVGGKYLEEHLSGAKTRLPEVRSGSNLCRLRISAARLLCP